MENKLNELNERQKEAAQHKDGPLLIIAGAGAGKTKTIAHRIANLIKEGVEPRHILAVTFTNKAAKEMADRVRILLPIDGVGGTPVLCTFHSLGVRILKENAEAIGRSKFFSILDSDESFAFFKRATREVGMDPKEINMKGISNIVSANKNKMIDMSDYQRESAPGYFKDTVLKIWKKYEELLKENEAYDFDDLILKTVHLLQNKKEILNYYQTLWKYIHIDEYQDTNTSQYELSRLLAEKHGNICVVGDSDQSIYGWRCADFRNILNFEQNFPGAKTVLLEQNYRSTGNILDLANRVIRKNKLRKEKNLFTENKEGEKITLFEALDENDEANFVVQKCRDLTTKKGVRPSEIAVLYRANFQSRALEEHFIRAGLPYQVLGTRFYERKEIKDIIAFIKFALNTKDNLSLARIINVPPRGIGKVTLEKIIAGKEGELPAGTREKIKDFRNKVEKIREVLLNSKLSESIKHIVKVTGLDMSLKEEGKEEGMERLENIRELANITTKYNSLTNEEAIQKFLEDTSLMSDQDAIMDRQARDGVRLMTVHSAKGLEFKYVFVTGLEQDLFPHRGWGDAEDTDTEEERRLFYVAITRAKEKLFISYAASRMIFGSRQMKMPSEFLEDIDDTIADVEKNENNLYEGHSRGGGSSWQKKEDDIIWDCLV
ncbi:MAG: ATP-dependent DNA helicase pcrA [Parcubacteria group bacterium GW2011_GWF2_38_76]|nr:MAG: ATP-dependent DNA helicase pcrA [Parcubacteria group bacterium GW2011_GWF2_38_76]HBM46134.1 ATP-dependent DNA helicase PcrA [Patescibacteria group bacterium]